ncbi:glycosyltransferase family 2 protein [Paenibacillaceae bacterium]|nr:glycosyltransferase family 2 protein [Paenibacillaceae bacterium]
MATSIGRKRHAGVRARRNRELFNKEAEMYTKGYEAGYVEGSASGKVGYGNYFEGTSIIIPSYNQAEYLKSCIDSIVQHTHIPYEIIVVDNASTDGTAAYLQEAKGKIRFHIMEENRGFSSAVNRGMMMAKGQTLLLLNNDTLVTQNWLDNMLAALASDERIGMVGPVTNYISGDQCIKEPYDSIDDMWEFARQNNVSDTTKWQFVDRLVGFCLLFRRNLFHQTGYFDEGYLVGNYEDEDFNIRVRLQGLRLVIARDSFIHHFGSVSMKELGERFEAINNHNEKYYMQKWRNPHGLIAQVHQLNTNDDRSNASDSSPMGESIFYPQHVAVCGLGATVYWVENNQRHPVEGEIAMPVTRLSQIDLQRWPIGSAVHADDVHRKWRGEEGVDGQVAAGADGNLYWLEAGTKRRIVSDTAAEAWGADKKSVAQSNAEHLSELVEGLPVIAPVRLAQRL